MTLKNMFNSLKKMSPWHRQMAALREEIQCQRARVDVLENINIGERIDTLKNQIRRITPRASLETVEMNIVSHCNLNCVLCSHSAPTAREEYMDLSFAQHDLLRLAKLSGGAVGCIHIMGGEPLLHPMCREFLIVARSLFPASVIKLVTNGLLLSEQPDAFWSCLAVNRIILAPTKYPIPVDWDAVEEISAEFGVMLQFYNDPNRVKTMTRFTVDPDGSRNPQDSFLNCACANANPTLYKGELYPCGIAATARYSDRCSAVSDADFIDIHKASDMKEVLAFLARPIPFCRFCDVENRVYGLPWDAMGVTRQA